MPAKLCYDGRGCRNEDLVEELERRVQELEHKSNQSRKAYNALYNRLMRQGCTHNGCAANNHTILCPLGVASMMIDCQRQAALEGGSGEEQ